MSRLNLDRVTITGADESVDPKALVDLAAEFPFAEWGILVSKNNEGGPRFPGRAWTRQLFDAAPPDLKFSLHVCGRWVRSLMLGEETFFTDYPWSHQFPRVQWNFHGWTHDVRLEAVAVMCRRRFPGQQLIVQMDGTSNETVLMELRAREIDCVPLFDTSGGAGRVPGEWPRPIPGVPYHGYAGGLGPETLPRELDRIAVAAGDARVWIDMERRVRSADDLQFDLTKVRRCLELAR